MLDAVTVKRFPRGSVFHLRSGGAPAYICSRAAPLRSAFCLRGQKPRCVFGRPMGCFQRCRVRTHSSPILVYLSARPGVITSISSPFRVFPTGMISTQRSLPLT